MGRNKECWGTKGVSASRKLVPCLSLGSRGRGEHDGCPVRAEAWRGCCGTPAWGPVAVGVVTKIHQRCHSLVGGGTEKEILWPLSLPSTFWLPAGIPTLSGPINQRPAGKGARREPSTRGCHPVTRQGRESGEHPGRNTKGGECVRVRDGKWERCSFKNPKSSSLNAIWMFSSCFPFYVASFCVYQFLLIWWDVMLNINNNYD